MYIVTNRVPVAEGWEAAFEERFRQRAGQVERSNGFLWMRILRPDTPQTPYLVMTAWADRTVFESWIGSEDFKAAHANPLPREAFSGEGGIERFEVIISAEAD